MIAKALLIILLIYSAISYETEGNILVLKNEDFPQVINDHEYILIKFYTSWCPHCQDMAPVFKDLADQFKARQSSGTFWQQKVTFARVQCTDNKNISDYYEIEGYPKFLFFYKGVRLDYAGQRNKLNMARWLDKIFKDPLVPIGQQQYDQLKNTDKTVLVFHGSSESQQAKIIRNIAYVDQFNQYFISQIGKEDGTLQMFRPLESTLVNHFINENIRLWITHNQVHLVWPFTDAIIEQIFVANKTAVCLFNQAQSQELQNVFKETAKIYKKQGKQLLFTNVQKTGQHFDRFGKDFLKIDPSKVAVALVDSEDGSKFILVKDPSTVTTQDIIKFLEDWKQKKLARYEMPDKIKELQTEQKGTSSKQSSPQQKKQLQKPSNQVNDEL